MRAEIPLDSLCRFGWFHSFRRVGKEAGIYIYSKWDRVSLELLEFFLVSSFSSLAGALPNGSVYEYDLPAIFLLPLLLLTMSSCLMFYIYLEKSRVHIRIPFLPATYSCTIIQTIFVFIFLFFFPGSFLSRTDLDKKGRS